MNDCELLKMAALAAGYGKASVSIYDYVSEIRDVHGNWRHWNPLTDDGDALRIAVHLHLSINVLETDVRVCTPLGAKCIVEVLYNGEDPCSATRRAIVKAAAEIGVARSTQL